MNRAKQQTMPGNKKDSTNAEQKTRRKKQKPRNEKREKDNNKQATKRPGGGRFRLVRASFIQFEGCRSAHCAQEKRTWGLASTEVDNVSLLSVKKA